MDIDIFQLPGILWRRKHYILLACAGCLVAALIYVALMKPTYSSSAELLLDPAALSVNGGDITGAQVSAMQDQSNLDSQIFVVLSRETLNEVVRKLDLTKDTFLVGKKPFPTRDAAEIAAAGALKQRLAVQRAGQSLVLTITATHSDMNKAAEIANAVAQAYLNQVEQARSDAARRASSAFQVQASELRDRVLKAELAVETFKSENGLVSTGERGLVVDQQLAGINDQLIAARAAEEQQRTIYDQARQLDLAAIEAGAIPEMLQSATMAQLRDRYTQLIDRQTQLSTTLGAGHPQLRTIRSQVANMQQSIVQELARIRQSMKANYDRAATNTKSLMDRLEAMTKSSFSSDAAQIKMRQLENEADAVRAVYKTFLSRAEELGQQQTVNTSNSRVITEATPTYKSQLVLKIVVLAAAGLFGIALGCALAILREVGGKMFAGAKAAVIEEPRLALPVLGRIPLTDTREGARNGIMVHLRSHARAGQEVASKHHLAVLKTAEHLMADIHDHMPIRIVFVAAGAVPQASILVSEIVQALTDSGQPLHYAPGTLREERPADSRTPRRPSLMRAFGQEDEGRLPLQNILHYERLGTPTFARYGGRPTYGHFIERYQDDEQDLVLIDATAPAIQPHLASLVQQCDGLIAISMEGRADLGDMTQFEAVLSRWPDKALGQIVLEHQDA